MTRHLALVIATAISLAVLPGSGFAQATTVTLLEYRTALPAGWTSKTPSSSMRLAEFVAPSSAGNAEMVVYYFGPGQGGDIEANVERWRGQFSNADGTPVFERVTSDSTGLAKLSIVEFRGTYARGMGTGSSAEDARRDNTLLAIIAETPRGTLYFQLFGVHKAVDAVRDAYLGLVRGLK